MRVLVDGIAFQNDYQRGVQRYFREVLSRIAQTDPVDLMLSDVTRSPLPVGCNLLIRKENFGAAKWNVPLRAWRKAMRRVAPTRISGHQVFHSSFFTLSPEPNIPEVVTVHDLIPERFEQQYHHWGQSYIARLVTAMRSASRLICISHATAADLEEFYPELMPKVSVVHHGADHFLTASDDATDNPVSKGQPPFLLYVGDRERYKNFDLLVDAMADSAWPAGLKVVATGPVPTDAEQKRIRKRNLQSAVKFLGPVPDRELRELFKSCAGFVFTSLCEGFGFPLLEAQSLRAPVLCSDVPIFREIGGGSALFFDPEDSHSLAVTAGKLLQTDCESLVTAGFANLQRFRWQTCAELTRKVYQSAVDSRS